MKDGAPLMALTSIAVLLAAVVLAPEQEIRIAAAADLKFAMGELAEEFEKQSRTKVNVTYGSSGNFSLKCKMGLLSICSFPRTVNIRKSWRPPDWRRPVLYPNTPWGG